jgi:5-methylcytosine-specific restriction protein A
VKAGRVRVASIRDHIVPLAEGGRDDESNVQPLCEECSDAKTIEESKRGRVREATGRGR